MNKLNYQWFSLLMCMLVLQGCVGFKPQNSAERIGYIQERLDTSLTAIERAYDSSLVDQQTKNRILDDYWQPAKDAEAEITRDFVVNGGADEGKIDKTLRQVKVMLAFLAAKGVMK